MKIIKKFFSLFLAISFMLTAMPVQAENADELPTPETKVFVWGKV